MKPKILIVDDDERLRNLLSRYLNEQGYETFTAIDAKEMNPLIESQEFHLIILDLMLPGEDGLSICRRLRGSNINTPILMLTAKSEEIDRILGLEMGADDYLPKPFNPRELLARINAILRRTALGAPILGTHTHTSPQENDKIIFGEFVLDLKARTLHRNNRIIPITTNEFILLKALAHHPNIPLSRDRLMELTHGREHDALNRSLDVQVSRLRRLIEDDPSNPIHIKTIWGVGYVFIPNA